MQDETRLKNIKLFVLGLARMGLSFFAAARIMLCSGFVTKTALITHQCFAYCWTVLAQHQGLLCFSLCAFKWAGCGWARGWQGAQPRLLTWTGQRHTPYSFIKLSLSRPTSFPLSLFLCPPPSCWEQGVTQQRSGYFSAGQGQPTTLLFSNKIHWAAELVIKCQIYQLIKKEAIIWQLKQRCVQFIF